MRATYVARDVLEVDARCNSVARDVSANVSGNVAPCVQALSHCLTLLQDIRFDVATPRIDMVLNKFKNRPVPSDTEYTSETTPLSKEKPTFDVRKS